jgi:hypothetical protein
MSYYFIRINPFLKNIGEYFLLTKTLEFYRSGDTFCQHFCFFLWAGKLKKDKYRPLGIVPCKVDVFYLPDLREGGSKLPRKYLYGGREKVF